MKANEIFAGDTEQCLKHYFRSYIKTVRNKSEEQAILINDLLINTVSISFEAIKNWAAGRHKPMGEPLFLVRYFLAMIGYKVNELGELNLLIYEIGLAIAMKRVDIKKATDEMSLREVGNALRYFHGKTKPSKDKMEMFELFHSINKEIIQSAVNEYNDMRDDFIRWYNENVNKDKESVEKKTIDEDQKIDALLKSISTDLVNKKISYNPMQLMHGINALFHVAESIKEPLSSILNNQTSVDVRVEFRNLLGNSALFHISNEFYMIAELINALCSEEARKSLFKNKDRG